jgi:uncharacterized heparinase superfamily protein
MGRQWVGPVDWDAPECSLLWKFHLHSFETAAALAAAEPGGSWQAWLAALLRDHLARCPAGTGTAHDPFVAATRLLHLLRLRARESARGTLQPALRDAIDERARLDAWAIASQVEHHLQGNHLLRERAALAVAAAAFAPGRRARARLLLSHEVATQFLPGGGHEERSPAYHLAALADALDARAALGEPLTDAAEDALRRAAAFALVLAHPDGEPPQWNDGSLGAPRAEVIASLLDVGRPEAGAHHFPVEGVTVVRADPEHLAFRWGRCTCPHQSGHAHGDILSFELSVAGQRVLTNRGTQAYGDGPERAASRSTAWANTVEIDGGEQIETWGAFRTGAIVEGQSSPPQVEDGAHVLVARLPWRGVGSRTHERTLRFEAGRRLLIEDRIAGTHAEAVARFHLPGADVVERSAAGLRLRTPGGPLLLSADGAELRADPVLLYPRLGEGIPGLRVQARMTSGRLRTEIRWGGGI